MKSYVVYQFIVQVLVIVALAKLNIIYALEEKNMLVVTKKVPFTSILTTAIFTGIFRIYSVTIVIHSKQYQFNPK